MIEIAVQAEIVQEQQAPALKRLSLLPGDAILKRNARRLMLFTICFAFNAFTQPAGSCFSPAHPREIAASAAARSPSVTKVLLLLPHNKKGRRLGGRDPGERNQ